MSDDEFELVEGSGNVFRDLGDPRADIKQAKAVLAARIIALRAQGRGEGVPVAVRMA